MACAFEHKIGANHLMVTNGRASSLVCKQGLMTELESLDVSVGQ